MTSDYPKELKPQATVIISVYNRIDFLKLVLAGLERQTLKDFEVIVSDDGSHEVFVSELQTIMATSPLKITHNWHEDNGFRKNKILNSSVLKAKADYLVFLDGDCIPHSHFVEEHVKNAQKGVCLVGRRTDLSKHITDRLTPQFIRNGGMETIGMFATMALDYMRAKLFYLMNAPYVKNAWLRRFFNRKDRGLLGANFSIAKEEMLKINGFDERYTQPTFGEDSDIELRLRLNKIHFQTVINIAVCYHCHHKLLPRPAESKAIYEQAVKEQRPFTPFGIVKPGNNRNQYPAMG